MNSMFKSYLPVDNEGFVTIANPNQILDKEINLKPLIRSLKKADLHLDVRTNAEVIVLTDEENEQDSESNFTSNHDESNDYDWHSASSQMGIQPSASSTHGPNVIETVSIDSPPPSSSTRAKDTERLTLFDRSPSMTSLESCDLNLDAPDLLDSTDRNVKRELHADAVNEPQSSSESLPSTSKEIPSTSKKMTTPGENGGNNDTLTSLNESLFNRLVSDINSTHLSVPADVNVSVESKISDSIESNRRIIDNSAEAINSEEASACDMSVENDPQLLADNDSQSNNIVPKSIDIVHSTTTTTTSSSSTYINHVDQTAADQPTSSVSQIDIEAAAIATPTAAVGSYLAKQQSDTDTNITSSDSPLKNHEETLQNIEEIVIDDLKGQEAMDVGDSVNVELDDVNDDVENEKMATDGDKNNLDESVQHQTSQEFLPAAESTASVCAETSLLSKSEQDVLFKDRDAAEMFNDLWSTNNGSQPSDDQLSASKVATPPAVIPKSPTTTSTPHHSHQSTSPLEFRGNGIDANARVKTYARRRQTTPRISEMKTMSTRTARASPSPITTIDDKGNDSQQKDKHLMTEKVDDELFLRDIFHTPPEVAPSRLRSSPRIKSPIMYTASSTPTVSAAHVATSCSLAKTVSSTANDSTVLHTTVETTANSTAATSSMFGSTLDTPVKRGRGRPRKYPLPEAGSAPPPKPPRQSRQPRKPKSPERDEDGEVIFERMVLRERKPKPPPPPPPPVQTRRSRSKTARKRGRPRKDETSPSKNKQPAQPRQTKTATTRGARAAVQKTTKQMAAEEKARKGRQKRRNTIKMTIDAIFNAQSQQISAIQARRISHILGIPFSAPQLTTILKRRNYNKSVNVSNSSQIRLNGQMNTTDPDAQVNNANTNDTNNDTTATAAASTSMPAPTSNTPSTILARKTYIKPNLSFSSLSNALRRMSRRISRRMSRRMSRRISFTRRISFSSMPRHPSVQVRPTNTRKGRKQSPQKSQSQQQRYEAIDIFDTSTKSKRGRKKGSKNSTPSKPRSPSKRKKEVASSHMMSINAWELQQQQLQQQYQQQQQQQSQMQQQPQASHQHVQHHYHQHSNVEIFETIGDTIELVDLTEEIAPFELDATNEMHMQFQNIEPTLSSTQRNIHPNDSSFMVVGSNKFPDYSRLDDIETDATNEFTTDPESAVEDADDSRTRRSRRSRKRPKILDL